ncbi:MAG: hypothetical protein ACFWTJ_05175 [Lachnoclostridium sp.]
MNRNKTFCEECRRDIEYMVETASIKGNLKAKNMSILERRLFVRNVEAKSM